MKFTLAIIPAFFTLSTFGSPVEPNARQMPMCNLAQCLSSITAPIANIPPCAAAGGNLDNIQQAQVQGKPPSQADQLDLVANILHCVAANSAVGFAIPAACYDCLGGLPGIPAPRIPS